MKKLTLQQRRDIYLYGLLTIDKCNNGLCYHLLNILEKDIYFSIDALEMFPEFALFKGKPDKSGYWFGGFDDDGKSEDDNNLRIIVLQFCIEMCN